MDRAISVICAMRPTFMKSTPGDTTPQEIFFWIAAAIAWRLLQFQRYKLRVGIYRVYFTLVHFSALQISIYSTLQSKIRPSSFLFIRASGFGLLDKSVQVQYSDESNIWATGIQIPTNLFPNSLRCHYFLYAVSLFVSSVVDRLLCLGAVPKFEVLGQGIRFRT